MKLCSNSGVVKLCPNQCMSLNCVPTRAYRKFVFQPGQCRSWEENCKVLTSEPGLLSDDYINTNRLIKYTIIVTRSGHAHKMPITPLMQACRSAYTLHQTYGRRKHKKGEGYVTEENYTNGLSIYI